jgi:hypothetical protein
MLTLQGFGLQLDSAIETLAQSWSRTLDLARGAVCFHIGVRLQVVPRLDGSRIAFLYEGKAYAIKDHGVLLPPIEN